MGTSNPSLSPEHLNLSESASPTIPVSLLEPDSQEVGSDDEGMMTNEQCCWINFNEKEHFLFQWILSFALIKHETSHKAIERLIKLLKVYTSIKSVTKSVKHKTIARFVVVQPFLNWLFIIYLW